MVLKFRTFIVLSHSWSHFLLLILFAWTYLKWGFAYQVSIKKFTCNWPIRAMQCSQYCECYGWVPSKTWGGGRCAIFKSWCTSWHID